MRKNTLFRNRHSGLLLKILRLTLFIFLAMYVEEIQGRAINNERISFEECVTIDSRLYPEDIETSSLVTCTVEQSGFWSISGTTATYDFGDGVIARVTTTTTDPFIKGEFNSAGTGFWSTALDGAISLQNKFTWGSTLTVSFEDNFGTPVSVENPIIHIDKLGEFFGTLQNSAELTLQGGLTWSFLGGTNDFLATTTTVKDAGSGTPTGIGYTSESTQNDDNGSAAGSLQINGTVTSFSMQFVQSGVAGFGDDTMKFILAACTDKDTDNDSVPDTSDVCSDFNDVADNDNDSVPDGCDLDNDNDGILDTDEGKCTLSQSGEWNISGTTATYDFGDGVIARAVTTNTRAFATGNFNPIGIGFWSETLENQKSLQNVYKWDTTLTISFEDGSGNPIKVNDPVIHFDRIGGTSGTQNSAEITLQGGLTWTPLGGTSDFRTRPTTVRDGGIGKKLTGPSGGESTQNDLDGSAAGSLRIHGTLSSFTIKFVQSGVNGFGEDGIEIILFTCNSRDTDGDNVPDYLDLDSDNDGIYDADEAGHAQSHTNGIVNGGVGIDGVPDVVQTVSGTSSGLVDYSLADSETTPDGIPDYRELDSDGDLCYDVIEAGYTDSDTNGFLGTGTFGGGLLVNSDGVVTSGIDGYTNGIVNGVTAQAVTPTISTQPENQSICPKGNTVFEVMTTNATSYQWQILNGTVWEDLSDMGIYTNTTTSSLTITRALVSDNGSRYRVLVSNAGNACAVLVTTSNEVVLAVTDIIKPTITCPTPPADIPFDLTNCNAIVPDLTSGVTVADNCSAVGNITITQTPAAGDVIGLGVTTITITAEDESNNKINCTVDIKVINVMDAANDLVTLDGDQGESSMNIVDDNDMLSCTNVTLGTDVTMTVTDNAPRDGVSLDPLTGEITVLANTPPGIYTIDYRLCSIATPIVCDDATVSITVTGVIAAIDDSVSLDGNSGESSVNIVDDNDTLNGISVTLGTDVTMTVMDNAPSDGVSIDPLTGEVTVLSNTLPGIYTIDYRLCSIATPVVCDDATVNITVTGVISAIDDTVTLNVNLREIPVNIVDDNDTLNGTNVTLGVDVTMTVTDNAPNDGVSLDPLTGEVIVLPNTRSGVYTIDYRLCSIATPVICDDATVSITVIGSILNANLALTKTGNYVDTNRNGTLNIGDQIEYTFTVENIGNVPITNITLDDPLPGVEIIGDPIDLDTGEKDSTTFSALYTLTEEDLISGSVSNQATVTGLDPDGNEVVDVSDNPLDDTNIDTDNDGDFEDVTVTILESVEEIITYTGITPNGDNINDQFRMLGLRNFPKNILRIFNRWGVAVFEKEGYEREGEELFEGISKGRATINDNEKLPVGTYFYVLEYENAIGVNKSKSGYLYINR
ncbi:gliding motility-associated C-terminal domain-containing protein [Aquimarina longa]|uniref:T9SS type B sorting domain-containing protein n=1 Tax=Aquimarina longa TaxID=1080221 RepID=UPI0007852039|nr:gliding motility-associated C-terminal domain-containing protein [Aquimarina longa]